MSSILIADTETNGFDPSIIWVLGILDFETDEYTSYTGDDIPEGLMRLSEADVVVFHNGRKYDAPVIHKLTEGLISIPDEKIIDTLELSRRLVKMEKHGLESWGEIFDLPKTKHTVPSFEKFHPAMVPYCERDVQITKRLFELALELAKEQNLDIFEIR